MNNSELKNEYHLGSSVFVNLCKQGDLSNLVKFVFEGESPYINHVPSKEKLTRNAIMFFCIGKHQSAIENFFQSPFMQFFDKIDKLEPLKNLISTESNDLIELLIEKLNLSQKDYKSLLFSACDYKSNSVKLMLNKYVNIKELTQEEKLECFLNILKSNTKNDNEIGILKFLEVKFDDFLYHQKDDLLTITAVANKQWDVVNYLMCEKKLRITKHLNALSWSDQTFAEIVRKRKIYDSLTMKMDNKILKEFPKIKKNKI